MNVEQGAPFEAVFESGETGLLATVTVKVIDNDGATVIGPTSIGITEDGTSGLYIWNAPAAPAALGQYTIVWSRDGTFSDSSIAVEDLVVLTAGFSLPSVGIELADSILCSAWTTVEDVVACCSAAIGSDTSYAEASVIASSELLYEASGRRYPGICERTVRPCDPIGCACGTQVLSRGHLVSWDGSCWGGLDCGCTPASKVKLAGRVREIVEVKIDGVIVDPADYFVEEGRWLVRRSPDRWPNCQTTSLPDTEEGTFSVDYTYGRTPPVAGQLAAQALACEVVKSCSPDVECALPNGVVRVTRQGITMERSFLVRNRDGVWATGIGELDLFLNSLNPSGIPRRGTFWSPSRRARYARPSIS